MKTFILHYGVYESDGAYHSHKTRVKNCMSELHAKVKLKDYVNRKYPGHVDFVVYGCREDPLSIFNDLLGPFDSNPFNMF